MTLQLVLLVSAALFAIGLYGALSQQVVVMVMMGIELMINGVLLAGEPCGGSSPPPPMGRPCCWWSLRR